MPGNAVPDGPGPDGPGPDGPGPEGLGPAIAAPALSRRRELGGASARALLMTVLGEYVLPRGEPVWTAVLVEALGLLGVAEKSARQALARSAAEGWLSPVRHGRRVRWELTGPGRQLLTDGAQRIYSFGRTPRDWDGRWLLVLVSVPDARRELRHRLRTRLTWAGFGALAAGVPGQSAGSSSAGSCGSRNGKPRQACTSRVWATS